MLAGILIFTIVFGVFFAFYKRHMLIKMFSLNIESMADEFRAAMESTADQAVKRLEHQMAQLEYLLEEADSKILELENQLSRTEERLTRSNSLMSQVVDKPLADAAKELSDRDSNQEATTLQNTSDATVSGPQKPLLTQFATNLQDIAQDKRQHVIILHKQGYNVMEIAKATSMGKGEVMLLLELNKN